MRRNGHFKGEKALVANFFWLLGWFIGSAGVSVTNPSIQEILKISHRKIAFGACEYCKFSKKYSLGILILNIVKKSVMCKENSCDLFHNNLNLTQTVQLLKHCT